MPLSYQFHSFFYQWVVFIFGYGNAFKIISLINYKVELIMMMMIMATQPTNNENVTDTTFGDKYFMNVE